MSGLGPVAKLPSPKAQVKLRPVPALTVALKCVACPARVGPLLAAARPLAARSVTVTMRLSGWLARPAASVTTSVKVSTAGTTGAVKVGWLIATLLSTMDGPPVCAQPNARGR